MGTQVVVITGARGGIGRATARLFAKRGAKVALLARGTVGLDAAAKDVEAAGGTALVIPTDVADYEQGRARSRQSRPASGPHRRVDQRRLHLRLRPLHPNRGPMVKSSGGRGVQLVGGSAQIHRTIRSRVLALRFSSGKKLDVPPSFFFSW